MFSDCLLSNLKVGYNSFCVVHSSDYDNLELTRVIAHLYQINNIVIIFGILRINNNVKTTDVCVPKEFRPKNNIRILFLRNMINFGDNFSTHDGGLSTEGYFYINGDSHNGPSLFCISYPL